MDSTITRIHGREILDSRGNPTLEVEVTLACAVTSRAGVPSGASTGSREAVELRDGDPDRYGGKGVRKTVVGIEETIAPSLIGANARCQAELDATMIALDGTADKARLGANAILGVSMACARAAADTSGLPLYQYLGGPGATRLPVPLMNILNGGVHAHGQGADIKEYMIAPYGAPTFREAVAGGARSIAHCRESLLGRDFPWELATKVASLLTSGPIASPWSSSSSQSRRRGSDQGLTSESRWTRPQVRSSTPDVTS